MTNTEEFWAEQANKFLLWSQPFRKVCQGSFQDGDIAWFVDGKLNAAACCLDQHLPERANQVAIIWEGDEPGDVRRITYQELFRDVCRVANAMKAQGVRKGDVVTVYMPMVPEAAAVMLACARLGAPHSVVFAGFSAEALRDRINDGQSKWVFTTDQGLRGGRVLELKKIVDKAVEGAPCVEKVFMFSRTGAAEVPFREGVDVRMDELARAQRPYCPAEPMDSEDLLFLLYTSGSTGRPKGLAHATAGYLAYTAFTTQNSFQLQEGDVFACVADVGWITGHSYIVYGPLVNGATTLMFESTPMYPDHGRYWDMVQRHKITQFYTAPTAIRALMRFGPEKVKEYDRSSLRVLGTVGEPINPEAWRWYHGVVGEGRCTIVDTFWQTETGGHVGTPIPGVSTLKAGSCSFPSNGIEFAILDPQSGRELEGNGVEGVLCIRRPWPSVARTVYGDHPRYLAVYMLAYPGYYFTGDGARRDETGHYWITGRVDDVLNTSGHRLGTAEIESALVLHAAVSEAAVIGFPHPVKGQGICCYVTLVEGFQDTPDLEKELKNQVRSTIGPFATPDLVVCTPGLPKTRSGKIMRRVLRKIVEAPEGKSQLGDVSTLADPSVVQILTDKVDSKMGW
uniref:Acetyl-coenzyme A synthetase n=1 Tax=Heterosigma akashiwo TaxID=2829 RepID=A0A7S3XKN4_HETAK